MDTEQAGVKAEAISNFLACSVCDKDSNDPLCWEPLFLDVSTSSQAV